MRVCVREIRSGRIAWLGQLEMMKEHRLTEKITKWKPIVFIPRGRPELKWKNDVKKYLKL